MHGVVDERLTAARLLAWTSPAYRVDALKRELDALPALTPVLWSDIDAVDEEVLFPAEAPARRQNSSSRPSRYARSGRIKSRGCRSSARVECVGRCGEWLLPSGRVWPLGGGAAAGRAAQRGQRRSRGCSSNARVECVGRCGGWEGGGVVGAATRRSLRWLIYLNV
jgi:hypothetical protein